MYHRSTSLCQSHVDRFSSSEVMMAQAKPDKSRQASANKPLGIEMLNAIDLLVLGYSDAQVAEQVGVTRQTICQWRHDSPQFLSELNRRRQGVWQAAHD